MLAVLLRADGWQVAYLGADTPLEDTLELSGTVGARLICLSAAVPERVGDLAAMLEHLRLPVGATLVLGGAGATSSAPRRSARRT